MNHKTTFTPLYDWIAERDDLSLLEKLIVCRVLRYGEGGCYESYSNIAKAFHVDRRQLIRTIKSLVQKQWLAPLPETKNRRVLWVDPERFSAGPLFDLPAVQKSKYSGLKPPADDSGSGLRPPVEPEVVVSDHQGSGLKPPEVVVSNHPSIEVLNNERRESKQQPNFQFEASTDKQKIRMYPIKGKNCSVPGCGMPAVYKDTSGAYDNHKCAEHMPEKVKQVYC